LNSVIKKYEDAIGFHWGCYLMKMFPQLYVAAQVQLVGDKNGKKPCIDFAFNGMNDIGIELIKNGTVNMCKEHADRFEGKYDRWKILVLF
jgi:hypothetical protein